MMYTKVNMLHVENQLEFLYQKLLNKLYNSGQLYFCISIAVESIQASPVLANNATAAVNYC